MNKVALISCVSLKADRPRSAKDLYISPLFKMSYNFAVKVGCSEIFILSAKYGIVADTQTIAPYDLTLNTMNKQERMAWGVRANKNIPELRKPDSQILLLAGTKYLEFLDLSKYRVYDPMKGLSIGRRLQYLKSRI